MNNIKKSVLFHYSPLSVMASYRSRYKEVVTVNRMTIRDIVRKILLINPDYSIETVENVLRYLVNQEKTDYTMHQYITNELREIYKQASEVHSRDCCCVVM
jgi:predicted metallopeptidase